MIKNVLAVTWTLGFLLCSLQTSLGCECMDVTVKDELSDADVVFVGKVIKITTAKEASIGMRYRSGVENPPWEIFVDEVQSVTLEVKEAFKGVTSDTVKVTSSYGGPGSCGVEFTEGEDYLVYAYKRRHWLAEDAAKQPEKSWTQEMRLREKADELNKILPPVAVNLCSRTGKLQWRGEDVDEVRRILKNSAPNGGKKNELASLSVWVISCGMGLVLK